MNQYSETGDDEEDASVALLLRNLGRREQPPLAISARVRQSARDEWRRVVAQRELRSRIVRYAALAALITAVAGAASLHWLRTGTDFVGFVARTQGTLEIAAGDSPWQRSSIAAHINKGTMLRTGYDAHASLIVSGESVRLDRDTWVVIRNADRISLERGAIYIDSRVPALASLRHELEIETPLGVVRQLGTQYAIRASNSGLEVSVREGRIQIDNGHTRYEAVHGEQLAVNASGTVERRSILPNDPSWQWAADMAPPFEIERQPLSVFLEWAARELGKTLEYDSPEVRSRASNVILRGAVSDLTPQQALMAVLATTPFKQQQTSSTIRIEL